MFKSSRKPFVSGQAPTCLVDHRRKNLAVVAIFTAQLTFPFAIGAVVTTTLITTLGLYAFRPSLHFCLPDKKHNQALSLRAIHGLVIHFLHVLICANFLFSVFYLRVVYFTDQSLNLNFYWFFQGPATRGPFYLIILQ